MNRDFNLGILQKNKEWDVAIIGGGATGLGIAVDAANRGFKTLLVERSDFAKGTSSRSTKLIHGGVRYLQNGDISLVIEALRERGILRKNAPHLVRDLSFVIPSYDWWSSPFYGFGLKVYDMMAGKLGLGPSTLLDKQETLNHIPNVNKKGLRGGIIYHDGQFDDARMAISLALTATKEGATLLNYAEVKSFTKDGGLINGLYFTDIINKKNYKIKAKVIVNATGVFSDQLIKLDQPNAKPMIRPSQGVHLVLEKKFLNGPYAIMVPQTSDGRVLFAVPWNNYVVVGTTDTPISKTSDEPTALKEEINFILRNAGNYMTKKPNISDVKSVFAGLRPLAASENKNEPTKEVSRHHKVTVSTSGLVSVLGGKWTTYRKIAEDTVNTVQTVGGFPEKKCNTEEIPIYGYDQNTNWQNPLHFYGTEAKKIESLSKDGNKSLSEKIHITKNQILWALREEMAFTLEDILARRMRCLFLDSFESEILAEEVVNIMADEMKKNSTWINQELKNFKSLVKNYKI